MLRSIVIFLFMALVSCEQEPLLEVQQENDVLIISSWWNQEDFNTIIMTGYFLDNNAYERLDEQIQLFSQVCGNNCYQDDFMQYLQYNTDGNFYSHYPDFYIITDNNTYTEWDSYPLIIDNTSVMEHNLETSLTNGDFVFIY